MIDKLRDVDVLIVGGGFSTMPLVRELEKENVNFVIVSDQQPIWEQLEAAGSNKFDLVSSIHSSTYSYELVEMFNQLEGDLEDRYQTAKEYYAIHKKYARRYAEKIHRARVNEIFNYPDHSLVCLDSGIHYRCGHVVIATAFRRKIHDALKQVRIDDRLAGKTVAVTSTGDSANLMMARLVAHGAKVQLVTNGFIALDKVFAIHSPQDKGARIVSLDQSECQNLAELSKWSYRAFITGGYLNGMIHPWMAKLLDRESMPVRHPSCNRPHDDIRHVFKARTAIENGHIAIKYWPVDTYELMFGDDLEQRIRDGYLLNDLPFFIEHGLVQVWDKSATRIDRRTKTLNDQGRSVSYDLILEGDHEVPNIPSVYIDGDRENEFEYRYRETLLGVVPPDLHNIYTVGFTRPTTGGLNNMSEMQSLLVHRLITDRDFHSRINSNIGERIREYNEKFYARRPPKTSDHLVYYGNYTDEVARVLEIRPSLRDARSLKDLSKYFMFPNNAFYYREKGRYKVEGVDRLVQHISERSHNYSVLFLLWLKYPFFEILALSTILLAPVPWWIKPFALVAHNRLPFTALLMGKMGIPSRESSLIFNYRKLIVYPVLAYPLLLPLTLGFAGVTTAFWLSLGLLGFGYFMVNLGSALGWNRKFFCDMRSKRDPRSLKFFQRYLETFRRVRRQEQEEQQPREVEPLSAGAKTGRAETALTEG